MKLASIQDIEIFSEEKLGQSYSFSVNSKVILIRQLNLNLQDVKKAVIEAFIARKNYVFLVNAYKESKLKVVSMLIKNKSIEIAKKGQEITSFYQKDGKFFSTLTKISVKDEDIKMEAEEKVDSGAIDEAVLMTEFDSPEDKIFEMEEKTPISPHQVKSDFSNIKSDFSVLGDESSILEDEDLQI